MVYMLLFIGESWNSESYRKVVVGREPVRTLLALEDSIWASCGNSVSVIGVSSLSIRVRFRLENSHLSSCSFALF